MKNLHELMKEDWDALYLIGRIARKLGIKKGQTIDHRLDEILDVVQSCYSVKEQPPEMVEALNKLNRSVR